MRWYLHRSVTICRSLYSVVLLLRRLGEARGSLNLRPSTLPVCPSAKTSLVGFLVPAQIEKFDNSERNNTRSESCSLIRRFSTVNRMGEKNSSPLNFLVIAP